MARLHIEGATVDYSDDGWVEFKKWLDGTYARLAYTWVDEGLAYSIAAVDGPLCRTCSINKVDAAEFEASYKINKPTEPRTPEGSQVIAPTFLYTGLTGGACKGYKYAAQAGVQNIFDELVTKQIYIQGGKYKVIGATDGDYAEFAVVDKNDVLGLFALYGLVVGQDVLELYKYIRTYYMLDANDSGEFKFESAARIYQGLFLRAIYMSVGATPVKMGVTYQWYEV